MSLRCNQLLSSILMLVLFLGLAFLLYSPSLRGDFQFDDQITIVDNLAIRHLADIRAIWQSFNTRFILGLSFALNYALSYLNPFSYHVTNVVIHGLNTFLVFLLIQLLFKTPIGSRSKLKPHARRLALSTALIFLAHPIQTEAVSYIWQRGTSLASFFYLSALLAYVYGRIQQKKYLIGSAFLLILLGMLTKEITFVFPILILLFECVFFGVPRPNEHRRWLTIGLFFLAMPLIPCLLMRESAGSLKLMDIQKVSTKNANIKQILSDMARTESPENLPRFQYTLTEFNVFRTYLRLLIWPVRQNIDYHYALSPGLADRGTQVSILLYSLIAVLGLWLLRNERVLAFAVFWFLLHLALESFVIVMPDIIFEHRLYLPMVGFAFFVSWILLKIFRRPTAIAVVLCAMIVSLSSASYARNLVWKDRLSLWDDALQNSPDKPRVNNNLAVAYLGKKDYEKALEFSQKAIRLNPKYVNAYRVSGFAHGKLGDIPSKIRYYEMAMSLDRKNPKRYVDLSIAYADAGWYQKALPLSLKAIEMHGPHLAAYNQVGYLYLRMDQLELARKHLEKALAMDPRSHRALLHLGVYYGKLEQFDEAKRYFEKAFTIKPQDPGTIFSLGLILENQGDRKKAESRYLEALRIDDTFLKAHDRLGVLYHGREEFEKSAYHFHKVIEAKPELAVHYKKYDIVESQK